MIKNIKKLSATILLITIFAISNAQIVNIEKNRKKQENGFQGTASFEFSIKETSKKIIEFKNIIDLQYKYNANTFIFVNSIKFLRYDTGNIINDGFQHIRYNHTFKDSSFVTSELFLQSQYNANKMLKKRYLVGAGLRFRIIDNEKISFFTAPLIMYEYEELEAETRNISQKIRLDWYANINLKIIKNINFNHITYYQPAINKLSDFRLSSETGIRYSITKNFALKMYYSADYDSQPPPNVQKLFYSLNTKLELMF